MTPILPPATIGILGSGQLGRMLAIEARYMGYRVHVYSPGSDTPTGHVADREFVGAYDDLAKVEEFARSADVITYEFENVPAATAAVCASHAPLHPGPQVLAVAQNRIVEKGTLEAAGLPVTPHLAVRSLGDLTRAVEIFGTPAVLKTAQSGYDGKGQVKITDPSQCAEAWEHIGRVEAVLEKFIPFEYEISVVGARGWDEKFVHYDVIVNDHHNHILDVSSAPATVPTAVRERALAAAERVFETLSVIGVLCVEFFVTADERVLINEIAPRPHNSGHLTIDGCVTSQFEQQLRAICGLPLGSTAYHAPTVMVNLLGDLWQSAEPNWAAALAQPNVHLHLYGKQAARVGRKMGHLTVTAPTLQEAKAQALAARAALRQSKSP